MSSIARQAFEEATGYNEVPKSAQDLLDLNSWPTWNMAWSKALPAVSPELREAVEVFVTAVDSECQNLDEERSPTVLREAISRMNFRLEVIGSQS